MLAATDLPVSKVFKRFDARKTDKAALKGLMDSIGEVGIINPLRVRQRAEAGTYEVTAGGHRLEAALKLGLETVPCIVVDDDDLHAELAMIDENLCRAELSPADRASQVARRKALYLELHPETAKGVAGGKGNATTANLATVHSFVDDTVAKTGAAERTVQREAERGEKIAADVLDKIKGTHLDKGTYLDELKKLPPDDQRRRVERALAKPEPPKRAPAPKNDFETKEDWMSAMMRVWNRGSKEWREEFLARIDQPIMDAA